MTTITKGRLLTIKQWRETYGPGSNVVLPAEEAEELARIALVSLEAKPIGAFHIAEQKVDGTSDYLKDGEWPIDNGIIEVYAAPPVPVVPEEKPMPNPLSMYAVDAVAAIAEVRGWNACRAAMLQAGNFRENKDSSTNNFRETSETSTNSPVIPDGLSTVCAEAYQVVGVMADALGVFGDAAVQKVLDNLSQQKLVHRDVLPFSLPVTPDGWISCSERMPEETGDIIVVSDGIVMSGISYSRRDGFYIAALEYDDDEPIDGVTHWMPLPEPPQEVNG
ncbi:Eaa prophage protein [Escherichia coli]|nr:Eaa prophage protein [Escherichia coli]